MRRRIWYYISRQAANNSMKEDVHDKMSINSCLSRRHHRAPPLTTRQAPGIGTGEYARANAPNTA
eukprot:scaffold9120_cov151-Isochrysis_galbana.AAC.2